MSLLLTVCAVSVRAQDMMPPLEEPDTFGVELRLVAPTVPIPRNGAILLRFALHGDPAGREPRPLLQVSKMDPVTATATTFPGTLRDLGSGYWAWTATTPLDIGDYQVAYAHPEHGSQFVTMTVVGDMLLELPAFTSTSFTTWVFEVTEQGSCLFGDGFGGFSPGPAFPIRERGRLMLQSNLTFVDDPVVWNQFLFRAVISTFDFGPFRDGMVPLMAGPFGDLEDTHCAHVEALEIATGTVHEYPDELCSTQEVLEDYSKERLVLRNELLNRFDCPRPPPGLEPLWCELNDQCIDIWRNEDIIFVNNCQDYFEHCPDAEPPDAGKPTTNDAGSDAGVVRLDGGTWSNGFVPPRDDASVDEPSGEGGGDSGCSVARPSRIPLPRGLAAPMLASAALALVRIRRRVICSARRVP